MPSLSGQELYARGRTAVLSCGGLTRKCFTVSSPILQTLRLVAVVSRLVIPEYPQSHLLLIPGQTAVPFYLHQPRASGGGDRQHLHHGRGEEGAEGVH